MPLQKIILSVLFLFSLQIVEAQNAFKSGHLITNVSDTLYGLIYFPGWSNIENGIQFKKNSTALTEQYKPESIQAFSINGEKYISKLVNIDLTPLKLIQSNNSSEILTKFTSKKVFLKLLVEGDVNLFYYYGSRDNFYIDTGSRFLQLISHITLRNVNERLVPGEENRNLYKIQLGSIKKCVDLDTKSLVYNRSSISDFVRKCNSIFSIDEEQLKPSKIWEVSNRIYLGVNYSRIKISYESNTMAFDPRVGYTFGVVSEFINTERNPSLSYYLGLGLTRNQSVLKKEQTLYHRDFYKLKSELTYADFISGFKFSYERSSLRPFVKLGINFSYLLYNNSIGFYEAPETSKSLQFTPTRTIAGKQIFKTNDLVLGLNTGTGISLNRVEISLNARIFKHHEKFIQTALGVQENKDRILSFDITASYKL